MKDEALSLEEISERPEHWLGAWNSFSHSRLSRGVRRILPLLFVSCLALFVAAAIPLFGVERGRATLETASAPAFPGAEGFGRVATGGRGGRAYHVTSLKDDGSPGTLRHAVSKESDEPLTVIFDVSGMIVLEKPLVIRRSNLTIAGQTAPGDGICLRDHPTTISADNVILRFLRFRLGDAKKVEGDALGGRGRRRIMIDHCSISWSTDECVSFYDNRDFTMQWCIASESLRSSVHAKGPHGYGGIWGGWNASFHHNLLACHDSRNPRLSGSRTTGAPESMTVDFRNNVVFGWGNETAYGGEGGRCNLVGNFYRPASWSRRRGFFRAYADSGENRQAKGVVGLFHLSGNVMHGDKELANDNAKGFSPPEGFEAEELLRDEAFPCAPIRTETAASAWRSVLKYAGASKSRDAVDRRIVALAKSGGRGGRIIDSQEDVGGYPVYREERTRLRDSDGDGLPDSWERRRGLDPKDPADGAAPAHAGSDRTNLEVWLDSLVADRFPAPEEQELAFDRATAPPLKQDLFDCFVSAAGRGDVRTIQEAIDRAPDRGGRPFHILIENGVYDEFLAVPKNKTGIRLHGQSRDGVVAWNDAVGKRIIPGVSEKETSVAATNVFADDFHAERMTFQNTRGRGIQALALQACGDRQSFRDCAFRSFQDTLLCRNPGTRQFFSECLIEGGVDFIYGAGTALFDSCSILCLPGGRWILAPSSRGTRADGTPFSGLILKNCRILRAAGVPDASQFFLRPWKDGAMAAVLGCAADSHIAPEGWDAWTDDPENPDSDNHRTGEFYESGTTDLQGVPLDLARRADWARTISRKKADALSDPDVVFRDDRGGGVWNAEAVARRPSPPAGLRFRDGELRWKKVPGAIGYLVERSGVLVACPRETRFVDRSPGSASAVWRVFAVGKNRNIGSPAEWRAARQTDASFRR